MIAFRLARAAALVLIGLLAACSALPGGGGRGVFVPQSDYGLPPQPSRYTEPGDCSGGSRLAALEVNDPEYPSRAFSRGQQGWVVVRLDVDAEGRTRNVRVIDAEPDGVFERAARATVRGWTFEPPGEPGLSRCVVVLDYRLGQGRIGL